MNLPNFRSWIETDKSMEQKRTILNRLDAVFAILGTSITLLQIYEWHTGHTSLKSVIAIFLMTPLNISISQALRRSESNYSLIQIFRSAFVNQLMAAFIAITTDGPLAPFWIIYLFTSAAVAPTLFYMRTNHLMISIQIVNLLNFFVVSEFFANGPADQGAIFKMGAMITLIATCSILVVHYLKISLHAQSRLAKELEVGTLKFRDQQQFLQGFIDHFPGIAFSKNKSGEITLSNRAAAEMLEKTLKQSTISGPLTGIFANLSSGDLGLLKHGGSLFTEESQSIGNGTEYFATTRFQISNPREGADLCTIAIDITQQRQHDQEYEQSKATMIAASKMSALGEMAGGIAHEINNPLMIIAGKAQRIFELAEDEQLDLNVIEKNAQKIVEITERITRITRALQSFAREASEAPFEPIPLEQIFSETLALCSERFRKSGVSIELDTSESIAIECRKSEVTQVLLHLLNNSFDAVQAFKEPWIRIAALDVGDSVEISVTDCGWGVPQELHEKIFQPFFTTKPIGKGTGLGLSIVDGIVGTHHGKLTLDRNSVQTKFTITLPKFQLDNDSRRAVPA